MSREHAANHEPTIAVVGLGFLGRGIITCLLGHGFRVIGCARSQESHAVARDFVEQGLREMVEQAGVSAGILDSWRSRYQETERFNDWGQCDFVIESVIEDAGTKQDEFERIENAVGPEVPIASNTSSIPISTLQQDRRYPDRFVGMHWFEPAHATRFLELIPGDRTSDATMAAAIDLAYGCGKEPSVLKKDIPGFIANRLAYAMYREALHLLQSGVADAETIDRSFRNACGVWSTVCGPLQWIDLTGGPVLYADCMKRVLPTLSNATELPESIRRLADNGARGIANGRGFYNYTPEQAEYAEELLREHAWTARALMNKYFPTQDR